MRTEKPTIIDVVYIQIEVSYACFLEHHNDSLMLLLVNMFCYLLFLFLTTHYFVVTIGPVFARRNISAANIAVFFLLCKLFSL